MLNADSPPILHVAQNIALIILSLCFLPLSTSILALNYGVRPFSRQLDIRQQRRGSAQFRPKTVLVTGVGMAKGLRIARAFYQAGHRVIGADFEPYGIPVNGRVSRAIAKYYRLTNPDVASQYSKDLIYIVQKEKVDLFITCSHAVFPLEDGHAMEILDRTTKCKSIQYDVKTTELLDDKDSFGQYLRALGLPSPETYRVDSRSAVHEVLNQSGGKKEYILKSIALDDLARVYLDVLPRPTQSQTQDHVSKLSISKSSPWVLQQYIRGKEYCTHSIVVGGEVKIFAACPSSELVMHYQPLAEESGLFRAMHQFTQDFVRRASGNLTGHLSFDFMVDEKVVEGGVQLKIYPIECNPRTHTAVVLFSGIKSSMDMVDGYLSVFNEQDPPGRATNAVEVGPPLIAPAAEEVEAVAHPQRTYTGHYWIGHDLVTLLLLPLFRLLTFQIELWQFIHQAATFLNHMVFWKDATFEIWDPLPWWWLYHVYWPGQFFNCIRIGKRWSRVNVSTKRILTC